jgi:hypothetical protein
VTPAVAGRVVARLRTAVLHVVRAIQRFVVRLAPLPRRAGTPQPATPEPRRTTPPATAPTARPARTPATSGSPPPERARNTAPDSDLGGAIRTGARAIRILRADGEVSVAAAVVFSLVGAMLLTSLGLLTVGHRRDATGPRRGGTTLRAMATQRGEVSIALAAAAVAIAIAYIAATRLA